MPINSFLYPAKHVPGAFEVANSLRFNSGDSPSLSRTSGGSPSSTTKGTFSFWLKRSKLGINDRFVTTNSLSDPYFQMYFDSNASRLDQIRLQCYNGSDGSVLELITNQKFRDNSAWYNIILSYDSTPSTPSSSSIKLFVNGTQVTSFATATYPSQNQNHYFNQGLMRLSGYGASSSDHTDGYMAEVVYCDGQALNADSFGEFDEDSGIWKPIDVSGLTFGTNGFYLDFEDSSSLGNDAAGSNNFTVNNLTAIDQTTDTCTNNFMTLNPLSTDSGVTLSEGNTESDFDASVGNAKGNFGLTKGRWYWEVNILNAASYYPMIGIGSMNEAQMTNPTGGSYPGGFTDSYGVYGNSLRHYANGVNEGTQGSNYGTGDTFGIYLDLESSTKTIKWYKNGSEVLSDDIVNAGDDYPYTCLDYNGGEGAVNVAYNFGNPAYTISSGNADDNGYGNFEYSPNISSTKYYAVCTKNLAEYG